MKYKFFGSIKKYLFIITGTLLLSFSVAVFFVPFNLIVGGVSGIAIVLNKIFNTNALSTDTLITITTWLLFFMGLIILGKKFALKTLIATVIYPLGITLFSKLLNKDVFNGIFLLRESGHPEISVILASIFGGLLVGVGCSLTFLGGGSTGGIDVMAIIFCKVFKRFRTSTAIFIIDAVIIFVGLFLIKDLAVSLLGIISVFVTALVIDKISLGGRKAFIAQIISGQYNEINKTIAEKLKRTTSIVDIKGGYSGESKKMLMVSFTLNQYNELISIISNIDRSAFVTVHKAHEINGEGWTF